MTHEAGTKAHIAGIQAAIYAFYHAEADSGEEEMENVIKAYLSASGMVLVPREPTPGMLISKDDIVTHVYGGDYNGYMDDDVARQTWKCMTSAAPDPFKSNK